VPCADGRLPGTQAGLPTPATVSRGISGSRMATNYGLTSFDAPPRSHCPPPARQGPWAAGCTQRTRARRRAQSRAQRPAVTRAEARRPGEHRRRRGQSHEGARACRRRRARHGRHPESDTDRSFQAAGQSGLGLFLVEGGKRGGELAPAVDAQAWVDPVQVGSDGTVRDEQALADLPVGQPLCCKCGYLRFLGRQLLTGGGRPRCGAAGAASGPGAGAAGHAPASSRPGAS
jgi:hypothetical protein